MKIVVVDMIERKKTQLNLTKYLMRKTLKKIKRLEVCVADTEYLVEVNFNTKFITCGVTKELFENLLKLNAQKA